MGRRDQTPQRAKVSRPKTRSRASFGRRHFLRHLSGAAALGRVLPAAASPLALARDPTQFLAALGKDPRMVVHDSATGVLETPISLLRIHRLTPKELLFVRNNQALPLGLTLNPHRSSDWRLELSGLVTRSKTVGVSELAGMEQTETTAVLQCAGNGRAFYSRTAPTKGTQWHRGGMGQIRWRGVRLRELLNRFKIRVDAQAEFLTAEGGDSPATPGDDDYEQSVPIADVTQTALLATHMNGEPIPAVHGGPLRLVLPGYYGSMNVKWLTRLRFQGQASTSRHHARRYRTFRERIEPGSAPPVTVDATAPTWRQRIKSVIWMPSDGEARFPGPITLSGVAWNDGRTEIAAIEVSVDRGHTWKRVNMDAAPSPFGWYPWSVRFWHGWNRHLIQSDTGTEVRVRAIDAFGRSQPDDGSVHWNPSGYEWFGVDTVKVSLR